MVARENSVFPKKRNIEIIMDSSLSATKKNYEK